MSEPHGLRSKVTAIHSDVTLFAHEADHSRLRVYPREITSELTLTAPSFADTYSAWSQLIPVNTVTMDYVIAGILIENWSAKDYFMIQLARNSSPTGSEYICELRFNTPLADDYRQTYPVIIKTGKIPENTGIYGRVKARSATGPFVTFSLGIQRWMKLSVEVTPTANWPW